MMSANLLQYLIVDVLRYMFAYDRPAITTAGRSADCGGYGLLTYRFIRYGPARQKDSGLVGVMR